MKHRFLALLVTVLALVGAAMISTSARADAPSDPVQPCTVEPSDPTGSGV